MSQRLFESASGQNWTGFCTCQPGRQGNAWCENNTAVGTDDADDKGKPIGIKQTEGDLKDSLFQYAGPEYKN